MSRGLFIAIEGADGSGTTTLMKRMLLKMSGDPRSTYGVVGTWQPSRLPTGMMIREMLTGKIPMPKSWRAMAHLFMADRIAHLEMEIEPELYRGKHVICDRYYPSTLVYQSADPDDIEHRSQRMWNLYSEMCGTFAAGSDEEEIGSLLLEPDLFLFLDIDREEATRRRATRGLPPEAYEDVVTQGRVIELYREWAENTPSVVRVDANQSVEFVDRVCWKAISELLESKRKPDPEWPPQA